jgi:hypothetical protein
MLGRRKLARGWLAAALAAAVALVPPVAQAADPQPFEQELERKLRDSAAKLMEAIEIIIRSIPIYGPPHIDEDGNIVIPRRRLPSPGPNDEKDEDAEPDEDTVESTST